MSDDMVRGYLTKDQPASKLMLLINPFTKLAGWPALGLGLLVVAATVAIAVAGRVLYDGIMDVHVGLAVPSWVLAILPLADWLIVAILFLLAGMIWGAKPQRVVDYFGMSALGRLPFLLVGLLWMEPVLGRFTPALMKLAQTTPGATPDFAAIPGFAWIVLGGVATMAIMLWGLFLNFFALREASGMKINLAIRAYIGIIIIGEILSKLLVMALL
ncbi:MAG: hypothetical protein ACYC63_17170 [Armatimonadota bacterium]